MRKKKTKPKKYALIRERCKDGKFLYSDALRKLNSKREAEMLLNSFETEYRNAVVNRKPIFDDRFSVKQF